MCKLEIRNFIVLELSGDFEKLKIPPKTIDKIAQNNIIAIFAVRVKANIALIYDANFKDFWTARRIAT